LTNQLAGYGVTFSTTDPEGVSWFGPGYYWPSAYYSIAAGDLGAVEFVDPIRVDFSTYATEASIRGFNGGGDLDTLILKAFDSSDTLVDSTSITAVFGTPGSVASVSASQIAYITFEVSAATNHGLFFDDLKFTSADVPEPSTLAIFSGLLGMAVIGHVWRRRRR
jgi:hypothetical protein